MEIKIKIMKYLIILFSFLALQSQAQVDTTKLPITLSFKVKHIGYMAGALVENNTLADARLRDSLIKYLGSGNNVDSVVVTHLKAGYVLSFMRGIFNESSKNTYATLYEIGNGATGFTGIVAQLLVKGLNGNDIESGTARWLFTEINNILTTGSGFMSDKFTSGKTWLKNPITYN